MDNDEIEDDGSFSFFLRKRRQAQEPVPHPPWAKGFHYRLEVGPKLGFGPHRPIDLGHQAGNLAVDIFAFCQCTDVLVPRFKMSFSDARFAQVIQHKELCRMSVHELCRRLQLPLENQQVVNKAEFFERVNASIKISIVQPRLVHLALQHMTNAFQPRIGSQIFQVPLHLRRSQRQPADHTLDEVICRRQLQQPPGFIQGLPGLHGDHAINARRANFPL